MPVAHIHYCNSPYNITALLFTCYSLQFISFCLKLCSYNYRSREGDRNLSLLYQSVIISSAPLCMRWSLNISTLVCFCPITDLYITNDRSCVIIAVPPSYATPFVLFIHDIAQSFSNLVHAQTSHAWLAWNSSWHYQDGDDTRGGKICSSRLLYSQQELSILTQACMHRSKISSSQGHSTLYVCPEIAT